jgi:hypothetical protein
MSADNSPVQDLQNRVSRLESQKLALFGMIQFLTTVVFALVGVLIGGGFVLAGNVIELEQRTYGTDHFTLIVLSVLVGGVLGGCLGFRFFGKQESS